APPPPPRGTARDRGTGRPGRPDSRRPDRLPAGPERSPGRGPPERYGGGAGMNTLSREAQSLTWLVNNFVTEGPGVTHAIVVSADGLLLVASDELTDEQAQQLSAG